MPPVGKHSAPEIGPGPELPGEPTRQLGSLPEPTRDRVGVSLRIAILVGVAATVLLSGLVWAVNRRVDPDVTAVTVGPPSLSWASPVAIETTSTATPSGDTGPVLSTDRPSPGPSVTPGSGTVASNPVAAITPAAGRSPTRAPVQSPTHPGPTGTPAPLTARFEKANTWSSGYQATYAISNPGPVAVKGWRVVVTFSGSGSISVWNASPDPGANHSVAFTAMSYNATVPAGGSVSFGFTMTGSPAPTPTNCVINGSHC